MSHWVQGQVISQQQWTANLYSIFIEAPMLPFEAGQFTQLSIEPHQPHVLFRPYSFANSPDERPLEFYYNVVGNGLFSTRLAQLRQGDPIWINSKSSGFFVLSTVQSASALWLLATGTALGVFLSILKSKTAWERFNDVVLVHSVHAVENLTHQSLLQEIEQRYQGRFHYLPVVTREKVRQIYDERITQGLLNGELERLVQLPLTPESSQVMLCGNPAMIKEATQILLERGLMLNRHKTPGHITIENYWK